jgi:hypothetical protein
LSTKKTLCMNGKKKQLYAWSVLYVKLKNDPDIVNSNKKIVSFCQQAQTATLTNIHKSQYPTTMTPSPKKVSILLFVVERIEPRPIVSLFSLMHSTTLKSLQCTTLMVPPCTGCISMPPNGPILLISGVYLQHHTWYATSILKTSHFTFSYWLQCQSICNCMYLTNSKVSLSTRC